MRFFVERDPAGFAERVRALLEADPANNVMATVLTSVVEGHHADPPPVFAYGADEPGMVAAAALRVPPHPMLCTGLGAGDADRLLDAWLAVDPEPDGVNGLAATARVIARAWERRTGGRARLRMSLAMHSLRAVTDPPRPGPGRLVRAVPEHADLLVAWWQAFGAEAGVVGDDASAAVAHRLGRGELWVWEDAPGQAAGAAGQADPVAGQADRVAGPGGAIRSVVGVNRPVAGVVRVGPVYTPPEHRQRGYASAAVAEVSRRALAAGAHTCMLFTDLANPTSNKIYADVGYRRVADWEEYELEPAPAAG